VLSRCPKSVKKRPFPGIRPFSLIRSEDTNGSLPDVVTTYVYDGAGLLAEESVKIGDGSWRTVRSSYSGLDRTGVEYPSGRALALAYTVRHRLDTVVSGADTYVAYGYNKAGAVTSATLGNGVVMTDTLNSMYRITKREYKDGAARRVGFSYGYDNVSNPNYQEALHKTTRSELYGYDGVHRLTTWKRGTLNGGKTDTDPTLQPQTWNLDDAGNWSSTTIDGTPESRTHDNTNFTTVKGGSSLARDNNGNTTDDLTNKYVYDALNRIVNVLDRTTEAEIATYVYDTRNRRVRKEVTSGDTAECVYDGWRVVAEYDGSANLDAEYVYGDYIDEPVAMYRDHNDDDDFADANELLYYATNRLYSVAALLDTSGSVVEGYEYTAYGKVTILDSNFDTTTYTYSQYGNPYLYTGRRYDDESGLYYYRNRYYSPNLGRFITRDPMYYAGGVNLYEYADSRPIPVADPHGHGGDKKKKKTPEPPPIPTQITDDIMLILGCSRATALQKLRDRRGDAQEGLWGELYLRAQSNRQWVALQRLATKYYATGRFPPGFAAISIRRRGKQTRRVFVHSSDMLWVPVWTRYAQSYYGDQVTPKEMLRYWKRLGARTTPRNPAFPLVDAGMPRAGKYVLVGNTAIRNFLRVDIQTRIGWTKKGSYETRTVTRGPVQLIPSTPKGKTYLTAMAFAGTTADRKMAEIAIRALEDKGVTFSLSLAGAAERAAVGIDKMGITFIKAGSYRSGPRKELMRLIPRKKQRTTLRLRYAGPCTTSGRWTGTVYWDAEPTYAGIRGQKSKTVKVVFPEAE